MRGSQGRAFGGFDLPTDQDTNGNQSGTKSAAIELYIKRKNQVRERTYMPENFARGGRISDLALAIEQDYAANKLKSFKSLKVRLKKHVLPFFGGMAAHSLGTEDLHRYVSKRQTEGAENATINRELAVLKRIFTLALKHDPPKVRKAPKFARLAENPPRQGFIDDSKYNILSQYADEHWLKAMLAVAYSCGFRKGELALRVKQIDLRNREIHLYAGTTKNGQGRLAGMTSEVHALMSEYVRNKGPEDYVFTRPNGEPVLDFRGAWFSLCECAALGRFVEDGGKKRWVGLLFHDLRRSAIRNMIRRGVDEKSAMTVSGHRTRTVFDRYNITNSRDIKNTTACVENGSEIPANMLNRTDTATGTSSTDDVVTQAA
jgi:integrase